MNGIGYFFQGVVLQLIIVQKVWIVNCISCFCFMILVVLGMEYCVVMGKFIVVNVVLWIDGCYVDI